MEVLPSIAVISSHVKVAFKKHTEIIFSENSLYVNLRSGLFFSLRRFGLNIPLRLQKQYERISPGVGQA